MHIATIQHASKWHHFETFTQEISRPNLIKFESIKFYYSALIIYHVYSYMSTENSNKNLVEENYFSIPPSWESKSIVRYARHYTQSKLCAFCGNSLQALTINSTVSMVAIGDVFGSTY